MRVKIRKVNTRLRSKKAMKHKPTVKGTGKWHSRQSLWLYKRKSRRVRKIAAASRRRNRHARTS